MRLPVVEGDRWFDSDSRPFVLRVEYPLTAEEMVAALYGIVESQDMSSDADLCGSVAVALSLEGLPGLQVRAARIRSDEHAGAIESESFLRVCRTRVTALSEALDRRASAAESGSP